MRNIVLFVALLVCLMCSNAVASDPVLLNCLVTPEVYSLVAMDNSLFVGRTNNLRRAPGSGFIASGSVLYLKGKVTDANCVPIVGAVVEIFQYDSNGKVLRDGAGDPYFLNSGRAVTDNLGNYSFISVMPGVGRDGRSSHIDFRVRHPNFATMNSEIFFNAKEAYRDPVVLSHVDPILVPMLVANKEKDNYYVFNITLSGENRTLHY